MLLESLSRRAQNSKIKVPWPFLQKRLIYAVKGNNQLNKPTNQRRRRRARRKSG